MTAGNYTMPAIETEYAGCRFRSRLEARWAVFFDHLGIPWEYEPQGFELPSGRWYLPDFWLPTCNTWFEVKGPRPDNADIEDFCAFAGSLPTVGGGDVGQPTSIDELAANHYLKVAVGDIPRPDAYETQFDSELLAFQPGWIWRVLPGVPPRPRHWCECPAGHKWVGWGWCWVCQFSLTGHHHLDTWAKGNPPSVVAAYTAARSARFEHGEVG